jgi:hypothetical protein
MSGKATRLESLILKEISGVDDPANESPGFAVFKSKGGDGDAFVTALAKAVEAAIDEATDVAAEDVAKAMSEALRPYTAVADALLKRIESVEKLLASSARKSLDGQDETPVIAGDKATVGDAFALVAKGATVELR